MTLNLLDNVRDKCAAAVQIQDAAIFHVFQHFIKRVQTMFRLVKIYIDESQLADFLCGHPGQVNVTVELKRLLSGVEDENFSVKTFE